jgi:kynureninase
MIRIADPPDWIRLADANDPLAEFKARFQLPPGVIYLDGNSLGALPKATPERLRRVIENEWGGDLIASWNKHDWIGAPARVGGKIARLIGAKPSEVVVADSTSVNLFKLLVAALGLQGGRRVILTEPDNFPTDGYIAEGVAGLFDGCRLRTAPADELEAAIDDDTAVVLLTQVHYKTGRRWDMARLVEAARQRGALVIWDLSHSAGAIPVDLGGSGAELAVGCGYKYLNGGPGAPSYLYVAERLQAQLASPLSGWMGHAAPFAFAPNYQPAPGIDRFLCGTPPILSLVALDEAIELMLEADMAAVADKAEALSDLVIAEMAPVCAEHGFTLISPRRFADRGAHVAFAHPHAYEICQALIGDGVVGDFRAPDALRLGPAPIYTSFADVWRAVRILEEVMERRLWDRPDYRTRARVT